MAFESVCEYLHHLRPLVEWVANPSGRTASFTPREWMERLRPFLNIFRRKHARLIAAIIPMKKRIADKLGLQRFLQNPYERLMAHGRV